MKRKVGLVIILFILFVPSLYANGESKTVHWTWETGTKIDVTAEIDSTALENGLHLVDITVKLIDLNNDANDIHDIELQHRIPGYYTTGIAHFDPMITVGNSQTLTRYFEYQKEWGTVYLEIKMECVEDIPLQPDIRIYTDWIVFLALTPFEETQTPTTTPTGNGFNIAEDWWVFVVGGVGLLGVGSFVASLIMRKR